MYLCKMLVSAQKCNYGDIVFTKSSLKAPGGLESQQTLTNRPFSPLLSV